jgi:cyclopropane-fatty-acyl-phospholipid synthase
MLQHFFDFILQKGRLTVIRADGSRFRSGTADGLPEPTVRFRCAKLERRFPSSPKSCLSLGYMDGSLTVEDGTLLDFMGLLARNMGRVHDYRPVKGAGLWQKALSYVEQYNSLHSAKRNASRHYDLSNDFFRLFLDEDMQYSGADFRTGAATLEEAQDVKQDGLIRKLALRPGQKVLDIGCGWGALAVRVAKSCEGVSVTGVTLAERQLEAARELAAREGVADRVRFELCDYRSVKGRYDRVVSVEMLEHVGRGYYDAYFGAVKRALTQDGIAVICSGGRKTPQPKTNAFLQNYIFPGGYTPALAQLLPSVEKKRLWVKDMDVRRSCYVKTLGLWHERFLANRDKAVAMFGERFCRMWELYLIGARLGYRYGYWMLFEMTLVRDFEAAEGGGKE